MVNGLSSEKLLSLLDGRGWFAPARAVLCRRALESSGEDAAISAFNDSLLYFPNASYIADRLFRREDSFFSDPSRNRDAVSDAGAKRCDEERPKVILAGADYFSREDYESVKDASLPDIGRIAMVDYSKPVEILDNPAGEEFDFSDMVTETLAQIYVEQGYNTEAEDIYRKLSLQSPEKSAYFASLIDNLKN